MTAITQKIGVWLLVLIHLDPNALVGHSIIFCLSSLYLVVIIKQIAYALSLKHFNATALMGDYFCSDSENSIVIIKQIGVC